MYMDSWNAFEAVGLSKHILFDRRGYISVCPFVSVLKGIVHVSIPW